jgi:hypothetical protein
MMLNSAFMAVIAHASCLNGRCLLATLLRCVVCACLLEQHVIAECYLQYSIRTLDHVLSDVVLQSAAVVVTICPPRVCADYSLKPFMSVTNVINSNRLMLQLGAAV